MNRTTRYVSTAVIVTAVIAHIAPTPAAIMPLTMAFIAIVTTVTAIDRDRTDLAAVLQAITKRFRR